MEVWLDYRHSQKSDIINNYNFDKIISQNEIENATNINISDDSIFLNKKLIGKRITISDSDSQKDAKQFVGSVAWIV